MQPRVEGFLYVYVFSLFERLKTVQPSPLGEDSKGTLGPAQAKSASGHHSRPQPTIESLQPASAIGDVVHAMRIGLKREQQEEAVDLLPRGSATNVQRGQGLDDATKAQRVCFCQTRTVLDLIRSAAYSVHALLYPPNMQIHIIIIIRTWGRTWGLSFLAHMLTTRNTQQCRKAFRRA